MHAAVGGSNPSVVFLYRDFTHQFILTQPQIIELVSLVGHMAIKGLTVALWVTHRESLTRFFVHWRQHRRLSRVYRSLNDLKVICKLEESGYPLPLS